MAQGRKGPTKAVLEITKGRVKPGSKAPEIIQAALDHPDMAYSELGKLLGCSHANVIATLNRYGIDRQRLTEYLDTEKLILADKKRAILTSITDEEIKSTSVRDRAVVFGIFDDHGKDQQENSGIKIEINVISDPSKVIDVTPS